MSDAPAAAPAAPAADGPSDATLSPADTGAKPAAPQPTAQERLEAVLREVGGLEVKAGGKTHKVDSVEKLLRYAQRGLPVEQSLETLAKQRAELEPVAQVLAQLRNGDEDGAEAALERLLDSGKLDKIAERRLRRLYEKEQQMSGMSERERAMAQQLEAERAERMKLAKEREEFQQRQQQAQEAQQVEAIKTHIGENIAKSLELMGLPPRLEAVAVNLMKPIIASSIRAGVALDPQTLADKVSPLFDELLAYRTKNAEGEALLKLFGDDVGRKYRKALLSKLESGQATATKAPSPGKQSETPAPAGGWDPRRVF